VAQAGTNVEGPRRARTRERLLDAAFAAFAEGGVAGTSVEVISERAGFTRGAFYSNFADKEELLLALMEREFEKRIGGLADRVDPASAQEAVVDVALLSELIGGLLDLELDEIGWAIVVSEFRLHALRNPELARAFNAQQNELNARLAAVLDALADRAALQFLIPTLDLARIVTAIHSQAITDGALADLDRAEAGALAARHLADVVGVLARPR
jgi:AcrR family transcriptional regulator